MSAQRSGRSVLPMSVVEMLRWPAEADRRDRDLHPGCLWLLPPGELPPVLDHGEDWIRLPADERDVHARVQRLAGRATGPAPLVPGEVVVGAGGLVARHGARVFLPPIEATLLGVLAARPESVVGRQELADAVWGEGAPTGRRLDSRLFSLRGRLAPVGLAIHTIRGRGYLLSSSPASAADGGAPRGRRHRAPRR